MSFFCSTVDFGPIDDLLNKVDMADADPASATSPTNHLTHHMPPSVHQFLAEEDLLRVFRADNKRLSAYLSRPNVLQQLVQISLTVPKKQTAVRQRKVQHTKSPFAVPPPVDADDVLVNGDADVMNNLPTTSTVTATPTATATTTTITTTITTTTANATLPASEPMPFATTSTALSVFAPIPTSTPTSTSTSTPTPTHSPTPIPIPTPVQPPSQQQQQQQQQPSHDVIVKHAYVASELLVSNATMISSMVNHRSVIHAMFQPLFETIPGELHNLIAVHLAKILTAMLKICNSEIMEHITAHSPSLMDALLRHIDNPTIANLFVTLLENPNADAVAVEHSSAAPFANAVAATAPPLKPPTEKALAYLVEADAMVKLADCFVNECVDVEATKLSSPCPQRQQQQQQAENNPSPSVLSLESGTEDEARVKRRRVRLEALSNITATILALSHRTLQFPMISLSVPHALCPYLNPSVISRMIDAGLSAICNTTANLTTHSHSRPLAFVQSNNTPLIYALALAADLLVSDTNLKRKRDNLEIVRGCVIRLRSERIIEDSTDASAKVQSVEVGAGGGGAVSMGESSVSAVVKRARVEDCKKKNDALAIKTDALEQELSARFPKLAELLPQRDMGDSEQTSPLGSLRLKLAEFFCICLKKGSRQVVSKLVELGIPRTLLSLFTKHEWSSMLHSVVTKSILHALGGNDPGSGARAAWFSAELVPWLMNSWVQCNDRDEDRGGSKRVGYMGHLIQIGDVLRTYLDGARNCEKSELPSQEVILKFAAFVRDKLQPAYELQATPLCIMNGPDTRETPRGMLDMTNVVMQTASTEPKNGLRANVDGSDAVKPMEVETFGAMTTFEETSSVAEKVAQSLARGAEVDMNPASHIKFSTTDVNVKDGQQALHRVKNGRISKFSKICGTQR